MRSVAAMKYYKPKTTLVPATSRGAPGQGSGEVNRTLLLVSQHRADEVEWSELFVS